MTHPLMIYIGILILISFVILPVSDALITWVILFVCSAVPISLIYWGIVGW